MAKQILVSDKTIYFLVYYVLGLMEDSERPVHVTDVIPPHFSQFVSICEREIGILKNFGVSYDRTTGWFRKIEE